MAEKNWSIDSNWLDAIEDSFSAVKDEFGELRAQASQALHGVYPHAVTKIKLVVDVGFREGPEGFSRVEREVLENMETRPEERKAIAKGLRTIRAAATQAGYDIPPNKAAYELVDSLKVQNSRTL